MAPDPPVPAANATPPAKFSGLIDGPLALAAAITAVLASTVGLLYVIGGVVMWLRFHEANLPADRAVALVPKNDLLILGLRVMVIPALLSGGFLLLLGSIWRAREMRLGQLEQAKAAEEQRLEEAEADPEAEERVKKLANDIERGQQPLLAKDRLPRPRTHPVRFAILVLLAVGLGLVVPFSLGSLAWPVVLVGLLAYWLHLRPDRLSSQGSAFPIWRLALAAVIGAATISIARQTDRPVELLSVRADVKNPSALVVDTFELAPMPVRAGGTERREVSGVLVAVRSKEIAIGDQTDRVITTLPRSSIASMTIGPPLDQQGPPSSLLSRLLHDARWSVTPFEQWCRNLRYGWDQIGKACDLAPSITVGETVSIDGDRIRGIDVACPEGVEDGCRGFVVMFTAEPVPQGSTLLPISFRPKSFVIDPGGHRSVRVVVDESDLYRQLESWRGGRGDQEVGVRILLSTESTGDAVVRRKTARLVVDAPPTAKSKPKSKHRSKPKHEASSGGGNQNSNTNTNSNRNTNGNTNTNGNSNSNSNENNENDENPQPTPATAAPTPTDSDPLPPQEDAMPAPTPEEEPVATP